MINLVSLQCPHSTNFNDAIVLDFSASDIGRTGNHGLVYLNDNLGTRSLAKT